jgi:drug/metabolite transporter (DMT)-like permease
MEKSGEFAAFATALCWTVSALLFEKASRKLGALAVNFYKVLIASFLLVAAAWILRGQAFPLDASPRAWLYLSVSGFIGFVIADYFLLNAYILIGSRITVIFQALTPLFTAFLAFAILGERMRPERLIGMSFVIAGILLVVLSRQRSGRGSAAGGARSENLASPAKSVAHPAKGYIFAFLASLFQATGLIFSKIGLGDYSAIAGTQIRILTAILGFALQALLLGKCRSVMREPLRHAGTMRFIFGGAIFGPFLGVSFSLFALQNTNAGAASTLMALTPILIIPPSILILKQKVHALELAGAILAVCGAALFFLL